MLLPCWLTKVSFVSLPPSFLLRTNPPVLRYLFGFLMATYGVSSWCSTYPKLLSRHMVAKCCYRKLTGPIFMYPLGRVIDFSAVDTVFMKAVLVKNKLHWDSGIFKHFLPVLTHACMHCVAVCPLIKGVCGNERHLLDGGALLSWNLLQHKTLLL